LLSETSVPPSGLVIWVNGFDALSDHPHAAPPFACAADEGETRANSGKPEEVVYLLINIKI
jgi:hypothetical protein